MERDAIRRRLKDIAGAVKLKLSHEDIYTMVATLHNEITDEEDKE